MILQQQTRSLQLHSSLDPEVVVMTAFRGVEELSQPFRFELDLVSKHAGQPSSRLVGSSLSFSVDLSDGNRRFFNGYVSELVADGAAEGTFRYRATVVPRLWFLSQTADCRIFQDKSVVEIVTQLFQELDDFRFDTSRLKGDYKRQDFCVQYRETDLNLVSRLLEQEGIYYYFEHEEGKHTLILADHPSGYLESPQEAVDFPPDRGELLIAEQITDWRHRYQFRPGEWAQSDYRFTSPTLDLNTRAAGTSESKERNKYEIYDYPGLYQEPEEGRVNTRRRMEADEVEQDSVSGSSTCTSFSAGGRFTVGKHPDPTESGQSYVITSLRHRAVEQRPYELGATIEGPHYQNSFTCIPASTIFRPPRVTPKPLISGTQTAIVVGPANEEIFCDEYGRIKVQFHWDREGSSDDASSCWIRVSQNSAGRKWGFMAIPRIGQEVVVDFLEGNPDRPMVVGSVYNAQQMPHYRLPENKTRTYIKTNSSKGGDGFNELMFDDRTGKELVFLRAQRDLHIDAINDGRERIGGDYHRTVGDEQNDQQGNELVLVHRDRHSSVQRHQVEHVAGNMQLTVGEGDVAGGGNLDLVVGGKHTQLIRGDDDHHIEGTQRKQVEGSVYQTIQQDLHQRVGANIAMEAGAKGEIHLKAGMKVVIETGVQLSLKGPGGFINIGPEGVTIQGNMVRINSGGSAATGAGSRPEPPAAAQVAQPARPGKPFQSQSGLKSAPNHQPQPGR